MPGSIDCNVPKGIPCAFVALSESFFLTGAFEFQNEWAGVLQTAPIKPLIQLGIVSAQFISCRFGKLRDFAWDVSVFDIIKFFQMIEPLA